MKGAIIGDIIGSVYEFHTIKQKQFKLFKPKCFFTDDTVLTCAVSLATIEYKKDHSIENFRKNVIENLKKMSKEYPNAGFGYSYDEWVNSDNSEPYNSYGNGGAMRTSSVAYVANSLEEALLLAKTQAEVTHNHEEGIKGAQAITACIYLARTGKSKEEIREYITKNFYPLDFKIRDIYRKYQYDITAQGSVPQAIEAFLEGEDFEDCIRTSISLGGDADTLAAMTGSIAEAYYGIPEDIEKKLPDYLDERLQKCVDDFYEEMKKKSNIEEMLQEEPKEEKNNYYK